MVEARLNQPFSASVEAFKPGVSNLAFTVSLLDYRRVEQFNSRQQVLDTLSRPTSATFMATSTQSLTNKLPAILTFVVDDDGARSMSCPLVVLCACENGGTCVKTKPQVRWVWWV